MYTPSATVRHAQSPSRMVPGLVGGARRLPSIVLDAQSQSPRTVLQGSLLRSSCADFERVDSWYHRRSDRLLYIGFSPDVKHTAHMGHRSLAPQLVMMRKPLTACNTSTMYVHGDRPVKLVLKNLWRNGVVSFSWLILLSAAVVQASEAVGVARAVHIVDTM